MWSQFTPQLVSALHANGLKVCAWQYVYGNSPVTEAYKGAAAVHDGADCLIIDAETEYEGKYVSAQIYIQRLRALIGYGYPLVLAGFPYVDFHPAFPYSVFLGPGGAQYNAPQMYWRDIGTTTDDVFAHTYAYNLIYERPIYPLGQVYGRPPAHQVVRFRQLSRVYGAAGVSWWDWQEARASDWTAVSRPAGTLPGYVPYKTMADVNPSESGDLVVWVQEHLISAGYPIGVDGDFGYHTLLDVQAFQTAHGLTADGIIGPATWAALLRYRIARVKWSVGQRQTRRPSPPRPSPPPSAAAPLTLVRAGPGLRLAARHAQRDRRRGRSRTSLGRAGRLHPTPTAGRCRARRRRARRASRWVFCWMCARWDSTVRTDRNSWAAISPLVWPSAIRRSTSTSRALRSSGGPPATGASAASRAPSSGLR